MSKFFSSVPRSIVAMFLVVATCGALLTMDIAQQPPRRHNTYIDNPGLYTKEAFPHGPVPLSYAEKKAARERDMAAAIPLSHARSAAARASKAIGKDFASLTLAQRQQLFRDAQFLYPGPGAINLDSLQSVENGMQFQTEDGSAFQTDLVIENGTLKYAEPHRAPATAAQPEIEDTPANEIVQQLDAQVHRAFLTHVATLDRR